MISLHHFMSGCFMTMGVGALSMLAVGCQNHPQNKTATTQESAHVSTIDTAPPAQALPTIRVDAGATEAVTDSKGVKWLADSGFDGGDVVDRSDLNVTGTDRPELYRTEHYSMDSYSSKVPNGDYIVKLHFSEDYDGIASKDDRRFTYVVKDGTPSAGKVIKKVEHFSPWEAAGAQFKAYIDTVPVTVTAGAISISFTPEVENAQINAIEIMPK